MVNECGHTLCSSCVNILFIRGQAPCPQCQINLKKTYFREQMFDDPAVDKEVFVRTKLLKVYNKREADFRFDLKFKQRLNENMTARKASTTIIWRRLKSSSGRQWTTRSGPKTRLRRMSGKINSWSGRITPNRVERADSYLSSHFLSRVKERERVVCPVADNQSITSLAQKKERKGEKARANEHYWKKKEMKKNKREHTHTHTHGKKKRRALCGA